MDTRCSDCLEVTPSTARYCLNCGRAFVPPRESPDLRRVVITGMGVISPLGLSLEDAWGSLLAGKSGVGPTTKALNADQYPCSFSFEVKDFEPEDYMDRKTAKRSTEAIQYALAAAHMAYEDAGLGSITLEPTRCGVVVGTASGGAITETERAMRRLFEKRKISPIRFSSVWPNMAAFAISSTFDFSGYNATITTACASGTQSLASAADAIKRGEVDVVLAGGTEAVNGEVGLAGYTAMRVLSQRKDAPQKASRPFDKQRDGLVPGEGSAMLVLESLAHAKARGARIYAEILGYSIGSDARHMTEPMPIFQAHTMQQAIASAGLQPEDVDYINPHATSTVVGDAKETQAIKLVFGERAYQLPVSATKSMTGHMLGAAGSFEAVVCALSIRDGWVHPTINYEFPDPLCDLDYVPNRARQTPVNVALSNSFGFGGQNAAIILAKME